jgi:hypothetical protein
MDPNPRIPLHFSLLQGIVSPNYVPVCECDIALSYTDNTHLISSI